MDIRIIDADTRVREDIGKAAVMRGPIVYCMEEADNGKDMHLLKMDENARFDTEKRQIATESLIAIKAQGWRQKKQESSDLYTVHKKLEFERTTLTWIPYYAWSNRGKGKCRSGQGFKRKVSGYHGLYLSTIFTTHNCRSKL